LNVATLLVDQIRFAREQTLARLEGVSRDDWFKMPEGITHLGWQIGHLAVAQYRICLERVRGVRPEDEQLVPPRYFDLFAKGSQPQADRTIYPDNDEIWDLFHRVHTRTLADLSQLSEADLDQPILGQHHVLKVKRDCLTYQLWHEAGHMGQIALVKRLLGYKPLL
jgi:hypothetical protein